MSHAGPWDIPAIMSGRINMACSDLQAAINCYLEDTDSTLLADSHFRDDPPLTELLYALDFLKIPIDLRPPGLRNQAQSRAKQDAYEEHLKPEV